MTAASPRSNFFYIYLICNEKLEVLGDNLTVLNETASLGLNHHYSEETEWAGNLALSEDK